MEFMLRGSLEPSYRCTLVVVEIEIEVKVEVEIVIVVVVVVVAVVVVVINLLGFQTIGRVVYNTFFLAASIRMSTCLSDLWSKVQGATCLFLLTCHWLVSLV